MHAVLAALLILPATALASEAAIQELERRLPIDGVETVNAYLKWRPSVMADLHQATADCNPRAVDLAARLSRGKDPKATDLHKESLRIAAGGCAEYVLSRLSPKEVPGICSLVSSWTMSQAARELRRRIGEIDTNESLRQTERGKACRAAYVDVLQNTRVGIRAGTPSPRSK